MFVESLEIEGLVVTLTLTRVINKSGAECIFTTNTPKTPRGEKEAGGLEADASGQRSIDHSLVMNFFELFRTNPIDLLLRL